ncbi:uncharacterized protein LOC143695529 [Agelaius phoeniceus]|uniref:uncharacterized protein LOC143695529 n=1 Tax=Agelaius phoeniceus TaxID=39638 RepID=UPI004054C8E3
MRVLPMQCMEFMYLYRSIGVCVSLCYTNVQQRLCFPFKCTYTCVCVRFPPPVGPGCSAPLLGRGPFPIPGSPFLVPGSWFPVPRSRFLVPIQPPSRDHLALGDDKPMARKEPLLSALKGGVLRLREGGGPCTDTSPHLVSLCQLLESILRKGLRQPAWGFRRRDYWHWLEQLPAGTSGR